MRILALTEKNILGLFNSKTDVKNWKKELIQFLSRKFILFFIISFSLLLFFWYYISCFCTIYINTQIHLIKDTIISFSLSMVYPLIINSLAGILRILSLRGRPNNNKKCFYYLSLIIQFI